MLLLAQEAADRSCNGRNGDHDDFMRGVPRVLRFIFFRTAQRQKPPLRTHLLSRGPEDTGRGRPRNGDVRGKDVFIAGGVTDVINAGRWGIYAGHYLGRGHNCIFRAVYRVRTLLRSCEVRDVMGLESVIMLAISTLTGVYLLYALLCPEKF